MKKSSCFREFLKYSSLNVLGMIALSCYILADTFFVSKALGANGLTALNLAIPVYNFINGSGLMIGMGGGTKYAIFKSQGRMKEASHAFTNAAVLTALIAACFFLLGLFASAPIARMLGADDTVFEMSRTYLQVLLLFAPMFMTNNLLLSFIRNDGAPQLSMAAMITGSMSNIVLDYVFMFPLGMGIFGAVLATGLAPVISILVQSSYLLTKKNQFHLVRCRLSARLSLGIFSSGLPSLITEVSSGIVIIIFNRIILGLEGNTGVAAYGVIANLSLVVIAVYTGISQGIQPILSSNYGKGIRENVQAILRYAVTTVVILSAGIYLCMFFGAEPITAIFNSEKNQILQEIAEAGLRIYFTGCVFAGLNIILSVYFTSTERPLPAQIISVMRGFIVIIPMSFLLSAVAGLPGVWASFPATEFLVSLVGVGLYAVMRKKS
ncbi:MATE family efflux transporter [Mediterraneibacter glycyrrhizinilyticus]|nr:MATE family efflux transporter [Mediterraneibacter glycyrrhizinilyticus]MBM6852677.1 MATE family efflux transporter [Mediterraneibacter glycyrrhizinilyticus]